MDIEVIGAHAQGHGKAAAAPDIDSTQVDVVIHAVEFERPGKAGAGLPRGTVYQNAVPQPDDIGRHRTPRFVERPVCNGAVEINRARNKYCVAHRRPQLSVIDRELNEVSTMVVVNMVDDDPAIDVAISEVPAVIQCVAIGIDGGGSVERNVERQETALGVRRETRGRPGVRRAFDHREAVAFDAGIIDEDGIEPIGIDFNHDKTQPGLRRDHHWMVQSATRHHQRRTAHNHVHRTLVRAGTQCRLDIQIRVGVDDHGRNQCRRVRIMAVEKEGPLVRMTVPGQDEIDSTRLQNRQRVFTHVLHGATAVGRVVGIVITLGVRGVMEERNDPVLRGRGNVRLQPVHH